jgi:hypothetical protein
VVTGLAAAGVAFAAHAVYHGRALRRYTDRLTLRLAARHTP